MANGYLATMYGAKRRGRSRKKFNPLIRSLERAEAKREATVAEDARKRWDSVQHELDDRVAELRKQGKLDPMKMGTLEKLRGIPGYEYIFR